MRDEYVIRPIAYVRSDYKEKFGIPKQCGLVTELEQAVVLAPEFRNSDALREIELFTHIWLIWGFSAISPDPDTGEVKWHPTVRPPRLGGKRVGVFASRSPYRPNSLGLSSVRLERIELDGRPVRTEDLSGQVSGELAIIVSGADLLDGTPVFDIKPYMPYSDSHPEASNGYSQGKGDPDLKVVFPNDLLNMIDEEKRAGLMQVLRLDPRDAYNKKDGSTYGLSFGRWNIRFTVTGEVLTVTNVE